MIKLKNLVEVIGKDKGSDSLANSRAKEFQGALTGLKKDIAVIERMIKDYKGGRPGKRKGDINYKLWSSRGFLIKISDITSKFNLIQDISKDNEKQSNDIESKIKAGTLKIKEVNSIVGVGYSNPEAQQLSVDAVNKAAKEIGKAQQRAVSIFTSDMKNKKYDNMDLANSIKQGNIRDASLSKRDLLSKLYFDVRDRFNKYNRRKK
tara:strand:- start:41 stop:658 length:618 start_codon:yes stop_codon:yes gene_type:complete